MCGPAERSCVMMTNQLKAFRRVNSAGLARAHHSLMKMNKNLLILKDLSSYDRKPTRIR